jgi:hypothetical protein
LKTSFFKQVIELKIQRKNSSRALRYENDVMGIEWMMVAQPFFGSFKLFNEPNNCDLVVSIVYDSACISKNGHNTNHYMSP